MVHIELPVMALTYAHRITLPNGEPLDTYLDDLGISDDELVADVMNQMGSDLEEPFFFYFTKHKPDTLAKFLKKPLITKMRKVLLDEEAVSTITEAVDLKRKSLKKKYKKMVRSQYPIEDKEWINKRVDEFVKPEIIAYRKKQQLKLEAEDAEETLNESTAIKILSLLYIYYNACWEANVKVRSCIRWLGIQSQKLEQEDSKELEKHKSKSEQYEFNQEFRKWFFRHQRNYEELKKNDSSLALHGKLMNWEDVLVIDKHDFLNTEQARRMVQSQYFKFARLFHPDHHSEFPHLVHFLSTRWHRLVEANNRAKYYLRHRKFD
jgi:hypothetical protein